MNQHRLIYKGKWTFPVAKAFILNPNISLGAKGVYLSIKSFCAPDSDTAFPSSALLSDSLNVNRDTVFKHVNELKERGYLRTEQKLEGGKFSHTVYTLFDEPVTVSEIIGHGKTGGGNVLSDKTDSKSDHVTRDTPLTRKPAGAGSRRGQTDKQKEAWRLKQFSDKVKELWNKAYTVAFPSQAYQFTGADSGQLRLFVKETKLTVEEIIKVATDAWAFKSKERFSHARNLRSLCYLCSKFNEIKSEIYENGSNGNGGNNAKTLNQGANGSVQYRGVGKVV